MRIAPATRAFTILLALLVALPSFGIDMSLPALTATGAALRVPPERVGMMMSVFMLGFGIAPLLSGPASDRYGRKPVAAFACALFAVGAIGCALSGSLPALLRWRLVEGAGAGASASIPLAIIRDLFDGETARRKLSDVAIVMLAVPMIAPSAGVLLLALGGWRAIHALLAAVGLAVVAAVMAGFAESARIDRANRLLPSVVGRNYLRVLNHPSAIGYVLVNAAAFASLFAYVSGSPLYLINVAGLQPQQYGLVFATTSLSIMAGAFLNTRLGAMRVSPDAAIGTGLALAAASAVSLLLMTLAGWMPLPPVLALLMAANLAFGLIVPNAMQRAMEPLPQIAGAAGAVTGCTQTMAGALSSALVTGLFDGRSALSMVAAMSVCALLALAMYGLVVRRREPARTFGYERNRIS